MSMPYVNAIFKSWSENHVVMVMWSTFSILGHLCHSDKWLWNRQLASHGFLEGNAAGEIGSLQSSIDETKHDTFCRFLQLNWMLPQRQKTGWGDQALIESSNDWVWDGSWCPQISTKNSRNMSLLCSVKGMPWTDGMARSSLIDETRIALWPAVI